MQSSAPQRVILNQPAFWLVAMAFLVANLLSIHIRSDAGLFEAIGLTNSFMDDIRRIGFPFVFFEEGGFVHRRVVRFLALFLDLSIGFVIALSAALAFRKKA